MTTTSEQIVLAAQRMKEAAEKLTGPNRYIEREMAHEKALNASLNETKATPIPIFPLEAINNPIAAKAPPGRARPSIIHRIKGQSPHFEDLANYKGAETRRDDRGYQAGDFLVINHYHPPVAGEIIGSYSGHVVFRKITHVLRDHEGLTPGYCMLTVAGLDHGDADVYKYLLDHPWSEEDTRANLLREQKARGMAAREWSAPEEPAPAFKLPKNGHEAFHSIADDLETAGSLEVDARGFLELPEDVYWSEEHDNFYRAKGNGAFEGCGTPFYRTHIKNRIYFPSSPDELLRRQGKINEEHEIAERLPAAAVVSHHENELLLHLTQEASEVIQAITKLQFFGKRTIEVKGRRYDNAKDLGVEIGNLQQMIHVVTAAGLVSEADIKNGMYRKAEGLDKHLTKK